MFVITASQYDPAAQSLAALWAGHDAVLLTPADLSTSGWRDYLNKDEGSMAVVSGQIVAVKELTGVYTCLPFVDEHELADIVPEDRAYVAAEMTAFLFSWLSRLKCPVLNRPTPASLSGPYWRQERWLYAAAQLGITVRRLRRQPALAAAPQFESVEPSSVTVTVIGSRCVGAVDGALAARARRLADLAQVDLLAVQFSSSEPGASFINASVWPDLADEEITNAILAYLQGR